MTLQYLKTFSESSRSLPQKPRKFCVGRIKRPIIRGFISRCQVMLGNPPANPSLASEATQNCCLTTNTTETSLSTRKVAVICVMSPSLFTLTLKRRRLHNRSCAFGEYLHDHDGQPHTPTSRKMRASLRYRDCPLAREQGRK